MRNFDLSPLYRSAIGFDRLFNLIESGQNQGGGYPPYNVELVDENHYRIAIAVAGFAESELDITAHDNMLWLKVRIRRQKPTAPIYIRALLSVISNANSSWQSIFKLKPLICPMACCISIWNVLFLNHQNRAVSTFVNSTVAIPLIRILTVRK